MTLDEIEAMIRARVNNPTETDQPKTKIYACANLAYHDICDRFHFREVRGRLRFETTTTENLYALPTGWYEVIRARYADSDDRGARLTKAGPNLAFDLDSGAVAGKPTHYALWGNEIQLYPPPDAVYAIELYMKFQPPKLVSPGDVPMLPPSWHYGIVALGQWYYWLGGGVRNPAAAQLALTDFTIWAAARPQPTLQELDDIEQAVEVPTLGRWSVHRHGDVAPEDWRTGGM